MKLDLLSTIKGSALEDFFPAGWDLERHIAADRRYPDAGAVVQSGPRDLEIHANVEGIAAQHLVRRNRDGDVEVAGRRAA